jgi:hypothetical protein
MFDGQPVVSGYTGELLVVVRSSPAGVLDVQHSVIEHMAHFVEKAGGYVL